MDPLSWDFSMFNLKKILSHHYGIIFPKEFDKKKKNTTPNSCIEPLSLET